MTLRKRTAPRGAPASYVETYNGLCDGLGVEDIAVISGHPVDLIHRHVLAMRRNGVLDEIYKKPRSAS